MTLPQAEQLYIGVDHEPAEQREVLQWIAGQLGASPPGVATSPDTNNRRHRTNKRCRNAKLLASGYIFRYPTFREGYAALLAQERL